MIRGADKSIRDHNEDTALDLINKGEVSNERLAGELRKMLVSQHQSNFFDLTFVRLLVG